jgi:hypothetical protein
MRVGQIGWIAFLLIGAMLDEPVLFRRTKPVPQQDC